MYYVSAFCIYLGVLFNNVDTPFFLCCSTKPNAPSVASSMYSGVKLKGYLEFVSQIRKNNTIPKIAMRNRVVMPVLPLRRAHSPEYAIIAIKNIWYPKLYEKKPKRYFPLYKTKSCKGVRC